MSNKLPPPPTGTHEVNHRFHTWGFVFLFGFMLPAMAIHALFFDAERGGGLLAVLALVGAPLAWWLLREARVRIQVSPEGVDTRPWWGDTRELPWAHIQRVDYSGLSRTLILEGTDGEAPVRVSLMRENVDTLARFLLNEVPPDRFQGEARKLFRLD